MNVSTLDEFAGIYNPMLFFYIFDIINIHLHIFSAFTTLVKRNIETFQIWLEWVSKAKST